jgi:hypothetical protein
VQIRTLPPSDISLFSFEKSGDLMNMGVWMSRGVLAHKRDASEDAAQVWNMKALPDELSRSPEPHRLFVAVDGLWHGFFVLQPWVHRNPNDDTYPWTLVFDANTWTAVTPEPAPPRNRDLGYTLDVPQVTSAS